MIAYFSKISISILILLTLFVPKQGNGVCVTTDSDVKSKLDRSDAVFLGDVISKSKIHAFDENLIKYKVKVVLVFKGGMDRGDEMDVYSENPGEVIDIRSQKISEEFHFKYRKIIRNRKGDDRAVFFSVYRPLDGVKKSSILFSGECDIYFDTFEDRGNRGLMEELNKIQSETFPSTYGGQVSEAHARWIERAISPDGKWKLVDIHCDQSFEFNGEKLSDNGGGGIAILLPKNTPVDAQSLWNNKSLSCPSIYSSGVGVSQWTNDSKYCVFLSWYPHGSRGALDVLPTTKEKPGSVEVGYVDDRISILDEDSVMVWEQSPREINGKTVLETKPVRYSISDILKSKGHI